MRGKNQRRTVDKSGKDALTDGYADDAERPVHVSAVFTLPQKFARRLSRLQHAPNPQAFAALVSKLSLPMPRNIKFELRCV